MLCVLVVLSVLCALCVLSVLSVLVVLSAASIISIVNVANVVNVVRQFLFSHGDFKESAKAGFCSADEGSDALHRVPESGRISD